MLYNSYFRYVFYVGLVTFISTPVNAQLTPDNTLGPERSIVESQSINGTPGQSISGGALRGTNLFHSFQDFNVQSGQAVYLNNPTQVLNILTRVTGANPSRISGTLGVLGSANLFLINPNGLIFGPNAKLNLSGSFLATTARSVSFSDGYVFSAANPQRVPLLTNNLPTELNFTGKTGSIQLQGSGHTLSQSATGLPSPVVGAGASISGLRVNPGQKISLVGGDIQFSGGIVTAPAGEINIIGINTGNVSITSGANVSSSGVNKLGDIQLDNQSLIDASGNGKGFISLQGSDITLLNGSLVLMQSPGIDSGGTINFRADSAVSLIGNTSVSPNSILDPAKIRSGIASMNYFGTGANINISTQKLTLQSGGGIVGYALLSGTSGSVSISASDSVQVTGSAPTNFFVSFSPSAIATGSIFNASSGNISISTGTLLVSDGGSIISATYGTGKGGDINVRAANSVEVSGFTNSNFPSSISSSAYSTGNAGNIAITSPKVGVLDGASISTSTVAGGSAANIDINASESVIVSGYVISSNFGSEAVFPTLISSGAIDLPPLPDALQQILQVPDTPSGDAGTVTIRTSNLDIDDFAQVSVRNDGTGIAGNLAISANSITLNNGNLTAATASGDGGNLQLDVGSLFLLRNQSNVTASATGQGQGGNINIHTGVLVLKDNSSISANADQNTAGNVSINTRGLFTDKTSTITATSNLGPQFDGIIQIDTSNIDFTRAAIPEVFPQNPTLLALCQPQTSGGSSTLIVEALGGYQIPVEMPSGNEPSWNSSSQAQAKTSVPDPQNNIAVTWKENLDGTISFVGAQEYVVTTQSIVCKNTKR
ncbi:MAG: filamentous hemagglutinin N-terminal domain-containing protein [Aphanocapsa sp. GSE-SYN-MK-11-07L]|jgi:filamentous hemagglutinin family protein|nr:filamentous hemagglutinin N-terminal domain-containing protein [Aphanocapsa sp. GSE-SYN-MK-11-07L]